MPEVFKSFVEIWTNAGAELSVAAWLVIGSVQLALLAIVASTLIRFVKGSAVWSHRLWLVVLLLTMGCLPVHVLSLGWLPVAWPANESLGESPTLATLANNSSRFPTASIAVDPPASGITIDGPASAHDATPSSADRTASQITDAKVVPPADAERQVFTAGAMLRPLTLAIFLYVLIMAWLVVRLLYGLRKLNLMWRSGGPLSHSSQAIFGDVADRIKLPYRFQVRAVKQLPMPLVYGVIRCRVLVPEDFELWTVEEQESVALHELTHVKRRDMLVEVASQLLCALYWFHPASWLLNRKLRESREWATDETVLRYGVSSSSYAHSIVAILSRLSAQSHRVSATSAVAMSLYGDVEKRLHRILTNASTKRLRQRGLSLIALLCLVAGATCFRIVAMDTTVAAQESPPVLSDSSKAHKIAQATLPSAQWATIAENENDLLSRIRDCEILTVEGDDYHSLLTVHGQVVTPNGRPVEGAIVLLRESSTQRISSEPTKYIQVANRHLVRTHDVIARTVTDQEGHYHFNKVKAPTLPFRNTWRGCVVAGHPTMGVGWLNLAPKVERVRVDLGMTIALSPVTNIQGRYVTPDDKPLSGVVMNLYKFYDDNERKIGINSEFDLQLSQLTPRDTTKADGSFILNSLPMDLIASLGGAVHQEWLPGSAFVVTGQHVRPDPFLLNMLTNMESVVVQSPCVIKADAGVKVSVRVVDPDKRPLAGMNVSLASTVDKQVTDIEGQARLHLLSRAVNPTNKLASVLRLYVMTPEDSDFLPAFFEVPLEQINPGRPVEIVLQKCVRVTGVVQDQAGQPVEKIMVTQHGDRMSALPRASTSADGRFMLKMVPGKHTLVIATDNPGFDLPMVSALSSGKFTVEADKPHLEIDVIDGHATDVGTIKVNRVEAVDVRVWLPDGNAAVGADVVIMDSDIDQVSSTIPHPIPSRRIELSKHVLTDELGQAQLLPTGKPTRQAVILAKFVDGTDSLIGEVTMPETLAGPLEVRLKPALKIEGRVLRDGKPLAGVVVEIGEQFGVGRGGNGVRYLGRTAVTDTEGWYRSTGDAGSDYIVTLQSVPGMSTPLPTTAGIELHTGELLRFSTISLTSGNFNGR